MKSFPRITRVSILIVFVLLSGPLFGQTFSEERVEEYLENGHLSRADSYLQSVLNKDPSHERALGYMIEISKKRNKTRDVYRYYRRLADRTPEQFKIYSPDDVYYHTGILAFHRGEYARSIWYLNRAQRQLGPRQVSLRERMQGWILRARSAQDRLMRKQRTKQRERIADTLGQMIADQNWEQARHFLEVQSDSIKNKNFLRSLEDSLALFQRIRSWHQFTKSLPETSSTEKLVENIRRGQKWLDASGTRPLSLFVENNRKDLQGTFNQISEKWIRPGLRRLTQRLGRIHFEQGNYKKALNPLLRAHNLSSKAHPEILETLSRVHYRLAQYPEARHYFTLWQQKASGAEIDRYLGWKIWFFHRGLWLGTIFSGILVLMIGGGILIHRYCGDLLTSLGEYLGGRFEL